MCIFFTTRNRHSETQIDWQFFLGFICVGQCYISWGRGSTHLSQVMPRPPFEICSRFSQWPRFTKCMVWYLIQPSVKQKPGIRMLINCERRSLDKEKQKEKRSTSQLWILVVHYLAAGNKMKSLEVYCTFNFLCSMPLSIGKFKLSASLLKSTSM